ncbi:disease resistance protein RGA2-like [Oryza brachyantha]|uniref:Uncharacterized protein n=1 Tax=Oryza brachyantha TaxID=4533 RepID=J3MLF2_ORYBR|nr:disease resistance protein RGA2-like [Oryza brachyantha]
MEELMDDNGWSLPAAIARVVGKLRLYLGNIGDSHKYKGTMKVLDSLEDKLKILHGENLLRVDADRDEEMAAWLRQVKEAAAEAEELVKAMEAEAAAGESSNLLLRVKYTVGKLVGACCEVESLLAVPDLDVDRLESRGDDIASLTPDQPFVVGRDEEIGIILDMVLNDACFVADESGEGRASADGSRISQKGWIIEALRSIDLSDQRKQAAEAAACQKEMGSRVKYTRVQNGSVSRMCNPTIIPIVGVGGVGKTALAQFIYNDSRVQEHFSGQSAWVYFTDSIRKEELMAQIFVSLQPEHNILDHAFSLNSLRIQLQSVTEGKKFLLVLDDVSDEIRAIWGDLRSALKKGAPGSVVLVTTQMYSVASFVGTTTPIFLDSLHCDDQWKLFKHHAFAGDQCTEALESIGRKIVDKFHGSLLAAKFIGASLRNCLHEAHWGRLLESWWWNISSSSFDIHIISSLGICYSELPAYLRQCLVFCSIFPRNYLFEKYELIQMWIANGFVELDNTTGPRILEDIAGEWFDELVNKCFLQPTVWKVWYIMHSWLRDFVIALSSNEYRGVDSTLGDLPLSVRHLSIDMDVMNVTWTDYGIKQLRSLILFSGFCHTNSSKGFNNVDIILDSSYDAVDSISERSYNTTDNDTIDNISDWSSFTFEDEVDLVAIILKRYCDIIGSILNRSRSLRLLSLSNLRANSATACVGDYPLEEDGIAQFVEFTTAHQMLPYLTHLRYLDFSHSGITKLPDSICSLCNLQVLGLRGCRFAQLPRRMNSLVGLRHLHADADTVALIHGIGQLTRLQDLYEYRVKAEDGHTLIELKDMRYIQGSLCISDLQLVANRAEAIQANLGSKENVNCLVLKWDRNQSSRGKHNLYGMKLNQYDRGQKEPLQASLVEKISTPSDMSGCLINPLEIIKPDQDMEILECLSPQRNLQKIHFFGYTGLAFPDWVVQLRYIKVIEINHCTELQVLPPFGQLEHLSKLILHELPSIKDVSSDVYGNSYVAFRSLEILSFESMAKLEKWADAGNEESFSNLQNLQINRCDNLRELPSMSLGLATRRLSLTGCGSYAGTVSRYLERLTSLTHLNINDCSQKLILPCQHLIPLEYLHLSNCKELYFEGGILCLNNLKSLHISGCRKIISDLEEEINQLFSNWEIRLGKDQSLVLKSRLLKLAKDLGTKRRELPLPGSPPKEDCIHALQSLTELTMDNLSQSLNLDNFLCKLSALRTLCLHKIHVISLQQEKWLEQITSLEELEFSCCYVLRQLPSNLAALSSLKKLNMQSCFQIHSLPLKGLPGNLKELQILGCSPILEARCQKLDGETWVEKKRGEWQKETINEYRQKKTCEFWNGWLEYEEEWVKSATGDLNDKGGWLNEEEDWLKCNTEELENNEDVWLKSRGEDWPKIAHIPYIRVNGDIIQNSYL